jgi:serine/threonine protein kinase
MLGETISHYRILEKLGGGSVGVVYKAEDINLGCRVALRVLPESFAADPQAIERFRREFRPVMTLKSPNICSIFEFGWPEGRWFIAMELLEGQTLKQRLVEAARDSTRWTSSLKRWTFLEFTMRIAEALDTAHAKGIIHRALKPTNIFVTPEGTPKILDIGLVNLAMPVASPPSTGDGRTLAIDGATDPEHLASPHAATSTLAYRSPEQVRGEELDVRTDLFSFGAVLYEMTTDRQAFSGPSKAAIDTAILRDAPPPPSQVNRELAPELDRIIAKALEKDRNLRYQHASEIRADLERLQLHPEWWPKPIILGEGQ